MTTHDAVSTGRFNVVRLPAEVDLGNSSEVLEGLLTAVARGGSHLVVDARDVTFLDSSALNVLVRARERTEAMAGSFHLVATSRRVHRLLEMTGLVRLLRPVDTLDEAATCIAGPAGTHTCGHDAGV
jgi:anti-anti-sigma factor